MKQKIRTILSDLESVRENLLSLSDDIWLDIDHNDSEAVNEGVEFKLAYNDKMAEFGNVADDLSDLIQQFACLDLEEEQEASEAERDADEQERIMKDLDREKRHSLDEDFKYKRPYGFVLTGQAFKDVSTWRRLYRLVCGILAERDPDLYDALPDNPDFQSSRGNRSFSENPDELRYALRLPRRLYAEANLSANYIRDHIRNLLRTFDIPEDEMTIYLRQDRDADS